MTPAPTLILKCSTCSRPARHEPPAAWNTFGATYWTDGKLDGPCVVEQLLVRRCPHCDAVVRIEDLEVIAHVDLQEDDDVPAHRFATLETRHLHRALLKPFANKVHELEFRRIVWWSENDRRRRSRAEHPLTTAEKLNLRKILELVGDGTAADETIMKAELTRELADFRTASAHVERLVGDSTPLAKVARFISGRIEARDPYVRALPDFGLGS